MADDPLERLLAASRADAHEAVRLLASAVEGAGVDFERRFTYGMLVYTLDARWRDWTVAIGVSKASVNLRFLHGDQLEDPAGLLRPGSSSLMTLDYTDAGEIDAELIGRYVREAVARRPG
jgi:hypothetical protein